MAAGEGDDLAIEVEIDLAGRRIGRIVEDDRDRLGDRMAHRPVDRRHEACIRRRRDATDRSTGHQEAESVNRIGRVRTQNHVARRGDRLRHVGKAFLGAERCHDLRVGVERNAEAPGVVAGLGLAQPGDALGGGITVGARVADDLAEFVDDELRRRQIGIAHAEVDDVGAAGARCSLEAVDLLEDVGRQPANLVKFFHGLLSPAHRRS